MEIKIKTGKTAVEKEKSFEEVKLRCMYTNLRSMLNQNKQEEIKEMLAVNKIDIIGITETWLHDGIDDSEITMAGFNQFRKDRLKGIKERGGGVILYCRDNLTVVDVSVEEDKKNESIWVELKQGAGKGVGIGLCYRSPTSEQNEVDSLLASVKRHAEDSTAVIMGDFNYGGIDWGGMQGSTVGERDFIDVINDCFLEQHVDRPTRKSNILDLIMSTEINVIENVEVDCPVANSDHCVITWDLILCKALKIESE